MDFLPAHKRFTNKLDLNEVAKDYNLTATIASEDEAERDARLRREEANDTYRRRKDAVVFGVGLLVMLGVSSSCLWVVLSPRFSADEKKGATAILTLLVGIIAGYLYGRAKTT